MHTYYKKILADQIHVLINKRNQCNKIYIVGCKLEQLIYNIHLCGNVMRLLMHNTQLGWFCDSRVHGELIVGEVTTNL